MPSLHRALAILACVALTAIPCLAQSKDKDAPPKVAAQGAIPNVGEVTLDYVYKNFVSGDGRMSLSAFRGSVVLIDWWGIH